METFTTVSFIATNILFTLLLGLYLMTNLQWYGYKIERVVLKHHKPLWHVFYFIIPFILYYTTGKFFMIFFYFAYIPALYIWYKRLDKKLVWTWRVKRFFILLTALVLFQDFLCTLKEVCVTYGVFMPLALAYGGSLLIEKYLFLLYKKEAKKKLDSMEELQIIAITGSYGKTSIKNFLHQILSYKFASYMTPRSVNTLAGIVQDINESLPQESRFYIVEAGARQKGDIYEIATFLNPQTVVVGKVGYAHIEYFGTLENIVATKLELLSSSRLQKAFIHCSVTDEPHPKVEFFCDDAVENLRATLDGIAFCATIDGKRECFEIPGILGAFQATNIYIAMKIAHYFGMTLEEIKRAVRLLRPIEHRLQKISAGGKIILDDGFNGNIEGMKEAIRLCYLHNGRKIIVTPGLIESTKELNEELIEAINGVFDTVIVTGKLNASLFEQKLRVERKFFLSDKSKLQELLSYETKEGDIILFANDAPNFI